jgi:glucose/arabinose dehydrogenase
MTDFAKRTHRAGLAVTTLLATALGILLIVLGPSEEAAGRGTPTGNGEGAVDLVQVGGSFAAPVNSAFAPGESDKAYVVEQGGLVKVVVGGTTQGTPFLDLTSQVAGSNEQGLLGLAFHPDYPAIPFVYAYYTRVGSGDIVVSEFDASDPLDADESSRRKVIRIRHRNAQNHNGGQLRFGPDDFLYMAPGDGGGGGDPNENAQNKKKLLGKLLRIDPLADANKPYTVPNSNPFVGKKGRDEIYALGLRNPFRFNFDADTGWIMIGDVGQDRFEEIDMESPATLRKANFGWDRWEGFARYRGFGDNSARKPSRKRHSKPTFAYDQSEGRSVVGGVIVRDLSLANLYGRYLFADFFADRLRSIKPKLKRVYNSKDLDGPAVSFISSFTEDPLTREIYVTSLGQGRLYRIEPDPNP